MPINYLLTICILVFILIIVCYILIYNKLRRLSVKIEESSSGIDVALEKRYDMLSEEIEAVKKFLKHEYDTYLAVTSVRSGKEFEEEVLKEKKTLSKEALNTIDEIIKTQQKQMTHIKKQIEIQHNSKSRREKNQVQQEIYKNNVSEYKMNIDKKIGLLSSIQQGLGGISSTINALSEQYPTLYSHVSMNNLQKSIFDAEEHLQAARRLYNANVSLYNQTIVMFPYSIVANIHGMHKADFYEVDEKKKEYKINFN